MELLQKVINIIAYTLNVEEKLISPTLSIGDIEEWNSMGNIAIITALEEAFNVEFPIDDLFELNSVDSFVNKIHELNNA